MNLRTCAPREEFRSACAFAQADQNLHCAPRTGRLGLGAFWIANDARGKIQGCSADSSLRWAQMPKGTFSQVATFVLT